MLQQPASAAAHSSSAGHVRELPGRWVQCMNWRAPAQIATCAMHKSGALLLAASDGDALDVHLRALQAPGPSSHTQTLLGARPLPSARPE